MKKLIGYLIFPFLFGKAGLLFFLPLLFTMPHAGIWLVVSFFYSLVFNLIVGQTGLLEWILDGVIRFLKIEYKEQGEWLYNAPIYGATVWSHPLVLINGKEYKFIVAEMGGNRYPSEARLKRKIISAYLFSKHKSDEQS
jgi:hypothetical protein